MDSFSQIRYISTRNSCNTDSSILGKIDTILFPDSLYLLRGETSVAEHSDLGSDMFPFLAAFVGHFEVVAQFLTHRDDAVRHELDFSVPVCVLVSENG